MTVAILIACSAIGRKEETFGKELFTSTTEGRSWDQESDPTQELAKQKGL